MLRTLAAGIWQSLSNPTHIQGAMDGMPRYRVHSYTAVFEDLFFSRCRLRIPPIRAEAAEWGGPALFSWFFWSGSPRGGGGVFFDTLPISALTGCCGQKKP